MAGLVLKDKSGKAVEYNGVSRVSIPYQNDAGTMGVQKFTRITNQNVYIISPEGNGYKIIDWANRIPNDDYMLFEFSENDVKDYGYEVENTHDGVVVSKELRLLLFVTTKTLTIGETYALADMHD